MKTTKHPFSKHQARVMTRMAQISQRKLRSVYPVW